MVTHLLQRVHRTVFSAVFPSANNLLPRASRLMQLIVCLLHSTFFSFCIPFRHCINAEIILKPYFGHTVPGGGFLFLTAWANAPLHLRFEHLHLS